MKTALIFGVTGQDGAYLTELLLSKGYVVHGTKRRSSSFNTQRVDRFYVPPLKEEKFFLHYGDLSDSLNVVRLVQEIRPDEIYNLGAMSHVRVSFETPEYTANIDGIGTLRILEAIRICGLSKKTKFYQASTSELYGLVQEVPQSEKTPFYPRSPYAVAKMYGYWITTNYREAYDIFACNGILFNHESPLRGETFVSRKISMSVARIAKGSKEILSLGNLDAQRDWGYAPEYVEGMWRMLQLDHPQDFVLATGKTVSVRRFVEESFKYIGIQLAWQGEAGSVHEHGIDTKTGRVLVNIDPIYFRPTEVDLLLGDPTKAKEVLGWEAKTTFEELVALMVEADLSNQDNLRFII